jgi:uncharacterized protein (TIGR03437 family)
LNSPIAVATDSDGNLYIADYDNYRVRKVDTNGVITTIAGTGDMLSSGDGGPAVSAQLDPIDVAVDSRGNVYVADNVNDRIRMLYMRTPATVAAVSSVQLSGTAGQPLGKPLTVRVVDAAGAPMAGVSVAFAITSGTATLTSAQAATNSNGQAETNVTLGAAGGEVVVTATVAGLTSVVFRINVASGAAVPVISAGGVVSAGLSRPAVRALSPNGLMSIFGESFSAGSAVRQVSTGDLENGRLPTRLGDVCVLVGGVRAPIILLSASQITFQSPAVASGGSAEVIVVTQCGSEQEQRSRAETVPAQAAAPEFFYFLQRPDGTNPIAAVNATTGKYVGLPGMIAGVDFVPARPGDIVTLYLTGLGKTNPDFAPGEFPGRAAPAAGVVTVTLGGVKLAADDVLYAGITPASPGLYQVNLRIPSDAGEGDLRVVVSLHAVDSPAVGVLAVTRQ